MAPISELSRSLRGAGAPVLCCAMVCPPRRAPLMPRRASSGGIVQRVAAPVKPRRGAQSIGLSSAGAVTSARTPWLWLSSNTLPIAAQASSVAMSSRAQRGRTDQVT